VTDDPADILGTPKHFTLTVIENPLKTLLAMKEVSGRGVQNPLGFARASTGVKDEKRLFGFHALRGTLGRNILPGHEFIPESISYVQHFHWLVEAADYNHSLHLRASLKSQVRLFLGGEGFASA